MSLSGVIAEQIRDYPRVHRSQANLAIHVVAIPLFWAGVVMTALGIDRGFLFAVVGLGAVVVSIGLQGIGHSLERERPQAFTGVGNFLVRLTTESLVVFPRYVVTGGFGRAWEGRAS